MRVLVDTNVIMDALSQREPFYANGKRVIKLCERDDVEGILAAHSVTNLFYLLRKYFTNDELRDILLGLCGIFSVEGIDKEKLMLALKNKGFSDFEDCLQAECAFIAEAEYIITRNGKDFANSRVPCIRPEEFCSLFDPDREFVSS